MNGKELETSYSNKNTLFAKIPDGLINNSAEYEFQVILKDVERIIISESPVYEIKR